MALIVKKNLILVEARKIEFKDKETGQPVQKFKYVFLTPDELLISGYLDTDDYLKEVQNVEGWESEKSKIYSFALSEFKGETSLKLLNKQNK